MGKYDFDDDDDDDFFNDKPKDRNPRNNPMPSIKYDPAAALRSVKSGVPPGQAAPLVSEAVRVKRYKDDNGFSYQDENLDDNFENTPFVPPNVTRAGDYKWSKIYKGARYDFIKMTHTNDMSSGVNMHFMFLKTMSFGLLFMTLCSIPVLIFSYSGKGMLVTEYDILQLDQFTIGNIGTASSPGALQCEPSAYATVNDTCITVLGSYDVPLSQISLVVTILEVIQVLVFLITVCHLSCNVDHLIESKASKEMTSATDYTVLVNNLPKDTTEIELIQHFSELYQLEKVDHKGRLPMEDARPVQFCDNSGDPAHVGTWVAECVIHKKVRSFILAGRKLVKMLEKLYFLKAKMKMHDIKSPYTKFINKELKEKAEAAMIAYADTIDKFIERKNKQFGIAQPPPPVKEEPKPLVPAAGEEKKDPEGEEKKEEPPAEEGKNAKNNNKKKSAMKQAKPKPEPVVAAAPPPVTDLEKALQPDIPFSKVITKPHKINKFRTTCAFVCFEYNESFARCIEDYSWYSYFPMSLFMPKKLLFKGKRLSVRKAPKPHQIVWENIDVYTPLKILLKLRTVLVGLLLIAVSLAVLLYAAHQRNLFVNVNATVAENICSTLVPELYTSDATLAYNPNLVPAMTYTRPEDIYAKTLDAQCDALIPGSFYMTFTSITLIGHATYTVGEYSFDSCANKTISDYEFVENNGLACPAFNQSEPYCPCVTTYLNTGCESKACAVGGESDPDCVHYTAGDIGTCYCTSVLESSVKSITGYLSLLMGAQPTGSPDLVMCDPFNFYFSKSEATLYVAIVVTSIVQAILRRTVSHLVRLECHMFKDDLQRSLFYKTFIATYLNLGVVILIAFGNAKGKPEILSFLNVFNGPYYDFTSDWYGSVGFYIVMTYFANLALPVAGAFLKYFLGIYLYTFKTYYQVDLGSSKTILVQHQLDVMEVGPVFDASVQSAQNLARLFIMMTFAAGIPLMTLLCLVAFLIHFATDKFMISFYNEKPKFLSNVVMKCVLSLLPYAAILRLCVGSWMLGADDVLVASFDPVGGASASAGGVNTNVISLANYMAFVDGLAGKQYAPASVQFIYDRAVRGNVLPLVVLLVLIILVKLIRKLVPFGLIGRGFKYLFKRCCGPKQQKIVKAKGFVHPYELVMSKHPLRKEAAPYTGNYFRYIPLEERMIHAETKGCLGCLKKAMQCTCCKRKNKHQEMSLLELMGEDWEEANVNNFDCYVKVWPATAKTLDGSTKLKGDHKRTYEVVRDNGSFSYDLEKIPGYALLVIAWKEFTSNPVLHDFFKRHPEKNPEVVAAKKAAEEAAKKADAEFGKNVEQSLAAAGAGAAGEEVNADGTIPLPKKKKKKKLLPPGTEPEPEAPAPVVEEVKPEPKKGFFGSLFGRKSTAAAAAASGTVVPVTEEAAAAGDPLKDSASLKVKVKPGTSSKSTKSNNQQEEDESGSESSSGSGSGSESGSGSGSGSSSGSGSGSGSGSSSGESESEEEES